MQYIALDVHKRYTWGLVEDEQGGTVKEGRIPHINGAIGRFLTGCEPGSSVAVETVGNWYWVIDEVEDAQMQPCLVHARKAKLMSGSINKTDRLDVRGMNRLQQAGTLPTVWIPPKELRDLRELPRTRMALVHQRTQLKNRIHGNLSKYGIRTDEVSDIFGVTGRKLLDQQLNLLPTQTQYATTRLLDELDHLQKQISGFEKRMKDLFTPTQALARIRTLPGVGLILGVVILTEVGDVERFPCASHLASYAGTTPRVHASGGKLRYGRTRHDVNRYLKWAFVEAANATVIHRRRYPNRHVSRLYVRLRSRRGHPKAIGAVARHLAEATYWMMSKREVYQDPSQTYQMVSTREA